MSFFAFSQSVYAVDTTYSNPLWSDISATANGNATCIASDFIGSRDGWSTSQMDAVAQDYCLNQGESAFVSYTPNPDSINGGIDNDPDTCVFNGSTWIYDTTGVADYLDIVCSTPSGCTNPDSANYDPNATIDDGSCTVCNGSNVSGCSQSSCDQFGQWDSANSQCIPNQLGCSDPYASNFDPNANVGSNQQYCLYCSPNSDPLNCSTQSDCEGIGGWFWNTSTAVCEDPIGGGDITFDGDITIQTPDPNSSTAYSNPVPAGSFSAFTASCIEFTSSGLCSRTRYDLSEDFLSFMVKTATNPVSIFLSLLLGFFVAYRLFLLIKRLVFHK